MKRLLYQMCGIAALAGLLFGYDTGVISGAILFIRHDFALTDTLTEMVVSAVLLGALFGSASGGKFTDLFGRRKVLIASSIIFIIGSFASAFAADATVLIVSRVMLGIAIGVSSAAAPLYLAEISPPEARGKLVSLNQLAITIGILISYISCFALAGSGLWRWMLGLGAVPALGFLVGLYFLPESPRWLVLHGGEDEKARKILQSIREPEVAEREMKDIRQSVSTPSDWKLLFAGWVRPILVITMGLSFFQQTTGINTIIYYAPTILQMSGFKEAQGAILATLGLGVVNVVATLVGLPLIDRWGRKPLLLIGLVGMCISLLMTGGAFYWKDAHWVNSAAVLSMVLYIVSFAISLGPVCWLIMSEIIPLRIRGIGSSLATSMSWISNMVVAMTFLTLVRNIGPTGTFALYAGLCVLAWLFVYFLVPETKGRTLEDIETDFRVRGMAGKKASGAILLDAMDSETVTHTS